MSKEHYEGMFGSLRHNILVMLSQIEANLEYSEGFDPNEDMDFIIKRCIDIKDKFAECTKDAGGKE